MGVTRDNLFDPSPKIIPTMRWILERFKERPRETASLEVAARNENMKLNERSYTRYVSDLKKHGLITQDAFGAYHVQPLGLQWLYIHRENA